MMPSHPLPVLRKAWSVTETALRANSNVRLHRVSIGLLAVLIAIRNGSLYM